MLLILFFLFLLLLSTIFLLLLFSSSLFLYLQEKHQLSAIPCHVHLRRPVHALKYFVADISFTTTLSTQHPHPVILLPPRTSSNLPFPHPHVLLLPSLILLVLPLLHSLFPHSIIILLPPRPSNLTTAAVTTF